MKGEMINAGCAIAEQIEFDSVEKDKFWVPVHRMIQEKNQQVNSGWIQMSLCLMPKKLAEKAPQGKAR